MTSKAVTLIFLALVIASDVGTACIEASADYQIKIADVSLDEQQLQTFCNEDICSETDDAILMRSTQKPAIALSFSDTELIEDAVLSFIAPYDVGEGGIIAREGFDPRSIEWKPVIANDLAFLRGQKIITLGDSDIDAIVALVQDPGALITHCGGEWVVVGQNCFCDEETNEISCQRCQAGTPTPLPELPGENLATDAGTEHLEEPVYDTEGNIVEPARPKEVEDQRPASASSASSSIQPETPQVTPPAPPEKSSPLSLPDDDLNELLPYVLAGLLVVGLVVIFAGKR